MSSQASVFKESKFLLTEHDRFFDNRVLFGLGGRKDLENVVCRHGTTYSSAPMSASHEANSNSHIITTLPATAYAP